MSADRVLIHTHGDLIVVTAVDGRVRAYEVEADGGLTELDSATAIALRSVRETEEATR